MPPAIAVVGRTDTLTEPQRRLLFERAPAADSALAMEVAAIIAEVQARGDAALLEYAARFDGAALGTLEVPRARWTAALDALDADVRAALTQAADAIAAFHEAQLPGELELETRAGVRVGRRAEPLRRVGVYAPGGRAAYPSSVLMGVMPARIAGVAEVIVCSPPGRDGLPAAVVLAAAAIARADRVFAVGGAGAIAALAYGTETVPPVDRIVGPGNAYVAEAKQQVARRVAIDAPAGPSEILVIADDSADARTIAAELSAQAEHDPNAACVLVTTDAALVDRTLHALSSVLDAQPRRAIIERALAAAGALLVAPDMDAALAFAERYAPEHLLLLTRSPRALLPRVRAAGTVFLGHGSSVVFGDYVTGANHVLPTGGQARVRGGLSTQDFLRMSTYQEVSDAAAADLAPVAATLAEAEGLAAHAAAARLRACAHGTAGVPSRAAPDAAEPEAGGAARRLPRLRDAYRELLPYDPQRVPCALDLSDNTNLFGANPAVAFAVRAAPADAITRYPSVYGNELKSAIARRLGVAPGNVVTGCGSDDLIDTAVRAFCEPGDRVAYPDPTFGMVHAFTRMNAARPVAVPLGPAFALDADALLGQRAPLTYVCRPNNPTGTLFDARALDRLEREAEGVVLVDEAYVDFSGEAGIAAAAAASTRTIALRTFSKAYGMAGLRVGFAIGPAALIAEIEKSRGPYKVSALAERAALAALTAGADWTRARADEAIETRERLASRLRALGLEPLPSAANFLLVPLPRAERAADWNLRLRALGVATRPFGGVAGAGECVRVTVGPWPAMEQFLTSVAALLESRHACGVTG
jgi:histidinol dehydrogenase